MIREELLPDGYVDMIHPDIKRKLNDETTPYEDNPIIPTAHTEHEELNFLEALALEKAFSL